MRRWAWILAVVGALLAERAPARAEEFYVADDGDDGHPGTMAQPFATVERAQAAASAGDTVYIRGGTYRFSGTQDTIGVEFTKSGAVGRPIKYFAYPGETPIFDLSELRPQARVTGLDVRCNWIHIRGLEVRGVRQQIVGDSWGVRIRGDNNVIEQLDVHHCEAPGIFITSGAANLILNCDSHHNYDPLEDGGNADGFGCHSTGGGNVMRGCRAYENSDDGFDFINAPGTCTVENSWAFRNGFIPDTNMTGANGAGFKAGGFGNPPNVPASGVPRHVVRNSVAFGNRSIGFYANYHPGGIDFFNNTAFDNPANFDMRTAGGTSTHKLRNNIAAAPGRDIVSFNGGTDSFNSWTLDVEVSTADFVSLDRAQALLPRQPDGSLPSATFARLVEGSDLIDCGEDVGLPFIGSAPDLGAYEWGEAPTGTPTDGGVLPDAGVVADGGVPGAGAGTGGGASGAGGASGRAPIVPPVSGGSAATAAGSSGAASARSTAPPAGAAGTSTHPTNAGSAAGTQGDGCSCRAGGARRAGPGAWLLLAVVPWIARRARHSHASSHRSRRDRAMGSCRRRRTWRR